VGRGTPAVVEYLKSRVLPGREMEYQRRCSSRMGERGRRGGVEGGGSLGSFTSGNGPIHHHHQQQQQHSVLSQKENSSNFGGGGGERGKIGDPMDPSSGLHLSEINRRKRELEVFLEDASQSGVGMSSNKLVIMRRDLAVLRAAELRAKGMGGV